MPEDLIDRIARERQRDREAKELRQRVALEQSEAVKENASSLWNDLADHVKFLVEKYNNRLRDPFSFSRPDDGQTPRLEVRHEVFPLSSLSIVQESAHLITFTIGRTEAWFSSDMGTHGRIQLTADLNRNIIMDVYSPSEQQRFLRAADLAEYLLESVFRSTRK